MARTRDMTKGNPVRLIVAFCLPLFAGSLLQTLYSLVDTMIIGRVEGVAALSAVSAAGWLDWVFLGLMMGLCQGFSVQAGQHFGAHDAQALRRSVGQSMLLALWGALAMEAVSQTTLRPLLLLLNSPPETIGMTETYLRIVFGGIPLVMGYNLFAGLLQAAGDSRTPFYAVISAAVANIALDLLCVAVLRWSVVGVAVATVASQGLSCVICARAVLRLPAMQTGREDRRPDPPVLRSLLRLGLPLAFSNLIIAMGGLVLNGVVNSYGFLFMAGYNAASRLQGLVEIAGSSIGTGMGTFAAQNFGAGDLPRVRRGLRSCVLISTALAALVASLMLLFGRQFMGLFVEDDPAVVGQVLDIGYQFLTYMAAGLFMLYLLFDFRSTLQGLGDTRIPMLSGAAELVMRILCALLLSRIAGVHGLYFAEISAWIGAAVLLMFGYRWRMRRLTLRAESQSTF